MHHYFRKQSQALAVLACGHLSHSALSQAQNDGKSSWWGGWMSYFSPVDQDTQFFLNYIKGKNHEGLMSWPSMITGIKNRCNDEAQLRKIIDESKAYVASSGGKIDEKTMATFTKNASDILYGKDVTSEQRQIYMEKYGCTAYTDEALSLIAQEVISRPGIVEIGAGNGQWARALQSDYKVNVIAFDSMKFLPLRGAMYAMKKKSPTSQLSPQEEEESLHTKFFHDNVLVGDENIFNVAHLRPVLAGRALLIVFPDPGEMAARCVSNYSGACDSNDMFIYVGEGRGGANGSDALFDILESGEWELRHTMKLNPLGGKGYERLFIFVRRRTIARCKD